MRSLLLALTALSVFAADDTGTKLTWQKLSDLKTGTELRVYRAAKTPVAATFADVNDDNLIVLIKNTETAIPKGEIERIDARGKGGKSMTTESRSKLDAPQVGAPTMHEGSGPVDSSSTSVNFGGGKGDFQTVYRRTAAGKPAGQK